MLRRTVVPSAYSAITASVMAASGMWLQSRSMALSGQLAREISSQLGPPAMWAPWLRKLFGAVRPGGHLVFSVHNESLAAHFSKEYGPDGTFFVPTSESRELEGEQYGTTFATRAWVEQEVERALGIPVSHFREAAFWFGQAAVVVQARR